MSVGSADLYKAINTLWNTSGLDTPFITLWKSGTETDEFVVLHDTEAGPSQPFPYCVLEMDDGDTTARMSGHDDIERHEIRDVPVKFNVHARAVDGDSRTAKEIAASLIGFIMQKYGGHPTVKPGSLGLDNGNVLLVQYTDDFGVKTGDNEYQWILDYIFRLDVPVAA